ncbi:hypothetical protein [Amycolatopsis eburnea]|uniref:Uncharacterized protein n=1 Tax=Amycolatopsis eburnea TaxID=2267691 RepID=A0A427TFT0_9PSEU|nr:hypothetical protein [Amycolatopsis eburnea]RSD21973.1 hypothetical protein EIY87_09150 [Amycolatopsis eburnea]
MTTTADDLVPTTFFIPGLRFRGQLADGDFAIIAHNALGAVELSWLSCGNPAPRSGQLIIHSGQSRTVAGLDESFTKVCKVLGGRCYATTSTARYRETFRPLLATGDMRAVCRELAGWHAEAFAGTRVTA